VDIHAEEGVHDAPEDPCQKEHRQQDQRNQHDA